MHLYKDCSNLDCSTFAGTSGITSLVTSLYACVGKPHLMGDETLHYTSTLGNSSHWVTVTLLFTRAIFMLSKRACRTRLRPLVSCCIKFKVSRYQSIIDSGDFFPKRTGSKALLNDIMLKSKKCLQCYLGSTFIWQSL